MGKTKHTIRNYRAEDLDKLAWLATEVDKLGQTWCHTSRQNLIDSLSHPHSTGNNVFVAEVAAYIIGYVDITPEVDIGRAVVSYLLHPEHHIQSLVTGLLDCAIHRARELGTRVIHVNIPQDSVANKKLLSKMSFRFVRRFLELGLDLSRVPLLDINQISPRCRHLRRGEEDILTQIQNRSFTGTWGYKPNTVGEVTYRISLPNCCPEDVIIIDDDDKPVGYCWTKVNSGHSLAGSKGKGYIYMLGVDPDYQGKGIGKQVLLAGLAHLKSKGLQTVELSVDSENGEACALYKSVGFKLRVKSLWYEKVLD